MKRLGFALCFLVLACLTFGQVLREGVPVKVEVVAYCKKPEELYVYFQLKDLKGEAIKADGLVELAIYKTNVVYLRTLKELMMKRGRKLFVTSFEVQKEDFQWVKREGVDGSEIDLLICEIGEIPFTTFDKFPVEDPRIPGRQVGEVELRFKLPNGVTLEGSFGVVFEFKKE